MRTLFATVALAVAAPAFAQTPMATSPVPPSAHHAELVAAVADERRGADADRDQWRHPVETIEFFRIEPGMTVVDHFPTPGWYTKILAPYLGSDGRYIGTMTTLRFASEEVQARQNDFATNFPESIREAWGTDTGAPVIGLNTKDVTEDMNGTVDRVLIFRMMHNLNRWGIAHDELTTMRNLLKDDGLLGIVQHRAQQDAPYSYSDGSKGYMREEDVIKLVEAHGFELVGASEINANPKNSANHEDGVWELPPSWRGEKPEMKEIGESDRMTLLFRKRP